jgi:hypothetical protein
MQYNVGQAKRRPRSLTRDGRLLVWLDGCNSISAIFAAIDMPASLPLGPLSNASNRVGPRAQSIVEPAWGDNGAVCMTFCFAEHDDSAARSR